MLKYNKIEVTSIASLEITRSDHTRYTVKVPIAEGYHEGHTVAKLERWLVAILIASPQIAVGETLGSPPPLQLRKPSKLQQLYHWKRVDQGVVQGSTSNGQATITLGQKNNGIYWEVLEQRNAKRDARRLSKTAGGIVFVANPQIHGYPWHVQAKTKNRNILKELKLQPKQSLQILASPKLKQILEKWTTRGQTDEWVQGLQSHTPQQLWEHRDMLTNFQVWVAYRMAAGQLNVHYEKEQDTHGCLLCQDGAGQRISVTHITWGCIRAKNFWKKCLEQWLGYEVTMERLHSYKGYFAARMVPPIGEKLQERITQRYGVWNVDYEDTFGRIWWALCGIENQGVNWRSAQQLDYMWKSLLRQLYAVARRERNRSTTRIRGIRLQLSLDCFADMNIEAEPADPPPRKAKWVKKKEQSLVKRLRKFQEAIN